MTSIFLIFAGILALGTLPLFWTWKKRSLDVFISFAAGVILSAAFIHMLPHATIVLNEKAGMFLLAGFLVIFIFEKFIIPHPANDPECHHYGMSTLLGLSLHSLIEGIAVGIATRQSTDLQFTAGVYAAVATHKVPEVLALSAVLLGSHWSKTKTIVGLIFYALINAISVSIGSLSPLSETLLNMAVALSAGTFIYIAATDLLPHMVRKDSWRWLNLFVFVLGVLLLSAEISGIK